LLGLGTGVTLLGVLRSLRAAGFDAMALPDVADFNRRSRAFRAGPLELAGLTPATLPDRAADLPAGTVLIPCSDAWVRAIAALGPELRARWPASVGSLETLETLLDKARLAQALERLGLPHPFTRQVQSPADLDRIPETALSSSFLKPADSQQFFARYAVKAFRTSNRAETVDRLASCAANGLEMLLQEYIPGPPTNHYFVDGFRDRGGTVRAWFARQRLRMHPPDFGNSTLMVSVPVTRVRDAIATLEALLADLAYRGVFSAEFKLDDRDHRFKLIEVNARPWWYVDFAARCGVDVCTMAVRDALGEPLSTVSNYVVGRRCVYPYYDYAAARTEWKAGRLGLLAWGRSWLGAVQPVFRWSDPLPALGELAAMARRRLS
jgi:predicted ATP-grasp superfamily ATP-dependent carboligase